MIRPLVVLGIALLALGGCRNQTLTVIPPSELPSDIYGPPRETPTAQVPKRGTVYMIREGHLVPVEVTLQGAATSEAGALLLALIDRPGDEQMRTAIPADTRINEVVVSGSTATVDLSEEFDRGGSGHARALRAAQIVYSLTEDPDVNAVSFRIDGFPIVVFDDQGNILPPLVDRSDFSEFAPREKDA